MVPILTLLLLAGEYDCRECEECLTIPPMVTDDPLAGEYRLIPDGSECPEGCSYTKNGEADTWCFKSGPYIPDTCQDIATPGTSQASNGQDLVTDIEGMSGSSSANVSDSPGSETPGPDTPGPDSPGPDSPGPDSPGPEMTGSQERTTAPEDMNKNTEDTAGITQAISTENTEAVGTEEGGTNRDLG